MSMTNAANTGMQSEINVTPMIDVLLVLLIIFMVIVPVTSKGESALAPKPAHKNAPANPDAVVLEVAAGKGGEAVYSINQQAVPRHELQVRLAGIYANRAERVLFVKGDGELQFTQIAEAIDFGHAAGVDNVALLTPQTGGGL